MKILREKRFGLGLISLLVICGCASVQLSPMQKRELTTRIIDSGYENVFRATMTVLQDQGYTIKNTDMDSGLILASVDRETGTGSQILQSLFTGFVGNKGSVVEVSATVSKLSAASTEIRLNIAEAGYGQYGSGGASSQKASKQLYDPKIYQNLFNEITTEGKRREAMNK